MAGPLEQQLSRHPLLILDGAMGTELQRRGVDTGLPLWSANALIAHPEAVLQIHKDYIEAGADIITTNTFRTTRRTLRRANLPDRSKQLVTLGVEQAIQARAHFPERSVLIAGSIAPLEDCYRPDLVPPDNELEDEHGELASRLAGCGVDFIILETMNTIREARAACAAATSTGKEVVVSFICTPDGRLLNGETLLDAVRAILPLHPLAFSINCVSPRNVTASILHLQSAAMLPVVVYGNVGLPESDKHGWEFTHDISEDDYAACAQQWKQRGVRIIGGCCGTTPAYTHALRHQFKDSTN